MRNSDKLFTYQPEGFKDWDINESCVQSDIADIISKMYTPLQSQPIISSGEPSCEVRRTTKREFSREIVYSEEESPKKLFGFHLQTVSTRKNDVRIKVDSSESDSTSYQFARNKLKTSRKVCECCRRRVWTSVSKKRTRCECGNYKALKSHKCLKSEEAPRVHQFEEKTSLANKDIRDIVNDNDCDEAYNQTRCYKSSPAFIGQLHSIQENSTVTSKQQDVCDSHSVSFPEELQVVPDTEVYICETQSSPSNLKPDEKGDLKTPSKSVVHRLFTSFGNVSLIFRKTFTQSSSQVPDNNIRNIQDTSKPKQSLRSKEAMPCTERLIKIKRNAANRIKFKRGFHSLPNTKQIVSILPAKNKSNAKYYNEIEAEPEADKSNLNLEKYESKCSKNHKNHEHVSRRVTIQSSSEENFICDAKRRSNHERTDDANVFKVNDEKVNLKLKVTDEGEVLKSKFHPFPLLKDQEKYVCTSCNTAQHDPEAQTHHPVYVHAMMVDDWAEQFWARVFAPCHIVTAFFSAFVLQLLTFILHSLVEPLVWGTLQIASEYFFQPCLSILFTGILQPIFMILKNIASSVRDLCLPISECFGHFFKEVSSICKACRLFEVHNNYNKDSGIL